MDAIDVASGGSDLDRWDETPRRDTGYVVLSLRAFWEQVRRSKVDGSTQFRLDWRAECVVQREV